MKFIISLRALLPSLLLFGLVACVVLLTLQTNANMESRSNAHAGAGTSASNFGNSQTTNVAGNYRVSGRNPDNSQYRGTLVITATGPIYRLAWQVGNSYEGTGIVQGNTLSAGWGGESCTVASYRVQRNGSLDGQWAIVGQNRLGTERAVRTAAAGNDLAGTYTVTGTNPDGAEYRGTLTIAARGSVYQFSWNTGNTFEGVGVRQGDTISVGWGAEECGVANYRIGTNETLSSLWGVYGQNQTGTEEATRQ